MRSHIAVVSRRGPLPPCAQDKHVGLETEDYVLLMLIEILARVFGIEAFYGISDLVKPLQGN